jgi:hypothetical protein
MQNDHTDHFNPTSMMILTQRMNQMITGEKVREAISDWYFENGKEEPLWYVPKNPPWWEEYLRSLEKE